MRILLVNPNISVSITERLATVARQAAAPGTQITALTALEELDLSGNQFKGSIPRDIGGMTNLVELNLANNQFSGSVPPELSNLSRLRTLALNGNPMNGLLPTGLAALPLNVFHYQDTMLCEPADPGFQIWLLNVPDRAGTNFTCPRLFLPVLGR